MKAKKAKKAKSTTNTKKDVESKWFVHWVRRFGTGGTAVGMQKHSTLTFSNEKDAEAFKDAVLKGDYVTEARVRMKV